MEKKKKKRKENTNPGGCSTVKVYIFLFLIFFNTILKVQKSNLKNPAFFLASQKIEGKEYSINYPK